VPLAIPVGGEIAGILGMFLVVQVAAIVAATWQLVLHPVGSAGAAAPYVTGTGIFRP